MCLESALAALKAATPEGYYLFPYTLAHYRMELMAIEQILNLELFASGFEPGALG